MKYIKPIDGLEFVTDDEALEFHKNGKPGKVSVAPTKPLITQRDLSLAYSPGVAAPCREIYKNPETAYDYTAKGNTVAVISNGTAVLGLGNLGALASKPVMEGKAVLFKRFADIDAIDLEVDTEDADEFINCVKFLGKSWGGINLEDIKAPECFIIEEKLRELMEIPVFHDDQHGTAIITLAALINAAYLTGREFKDIKVVVNGAGAAGIACLELIKHYGVPHENVALCDTKGVVYKGRTDNMNKWKANHAIETQARTLAEVMKGADVFLGLSSKGAITQEMVMSMAEKPIIFAMANPDPEITPSEVKQVRADAIIATGRSDFPNQVNNVMGFPYIFRGTLDVHARTINDEMKIAAAEALAMLARETVPDAVSRSYNGKKMLFGNEYIIPVPFDNRLITTIPIAVAKAAIKSGVAKKIITDFDEYKSQLGSRLDRTYTSMNAILAKVKNTSKRAIFSEGEEEEVIRAALLWKNNGYGIPILVGKEKHILEVARNIGAEKDLEGIEIWNAANVSEEKLNSYIDYLYSKTNREGNLYRDCVRLVKTARNIFSACMLACGDGDVLITGLTRGYHISLDEIKQAIPLRKNYTLFAMSMLVTESQTIFIADTNVNEHPTSEELANIAEQTAKLVKEFGYSPRVAMLSFSNFGNPMRERAQRIRDAVAELDKRNVDFEYEGEMGPDVALNADLLAKFPFSRLSKPANILIMPALHTANISSKLIHELGGGVFIGPMLSGFEKPVQIIPMGASVSEIVNLAIFAVSQIA
jgi:malate dehydrogenase (oxaloacetate-decarboxylating)(NADP+)